MPIVRYSIRVFVGLVLCGLGACSWLTEESKPNKRAVYGPGDWFYKECHQLDSVQLVFEDTTSLSMQTLVAEVLVADRRVMNHYEPFCQLVDTAALQLHVAVDQEYNSSGIVVRDGVLWLELAHEALLEQLDFRTQVQTDLDAFFVQARYANLLSNGYNKANYTELKKRHAFTLKLPDGFEIIRQKKDFIWARTNESNVNAHLLVQRRPYASQSQFEIDELIRLRDDVLKKHVLYTNYDSLRYAQTEFYFPLKIADEVLPHFYAKRITGCWSVNKDLKKGGAMGGPFLALALVGASQPENFYYVEAFFSAPNEDKLPFIRTLQAILRTFELNSYE